MRKDMIQGPAPPARAPARRPEIVWPLPGERLSVVLLEDTITSYWTHWLPTAGDVGGRTALCLGGCGKGPCPFVTPRKWCGYMAATLEGRGEPVVVMLTEEGARGLLDATKDYAHLRGLVVELSRGEGPHNGIVRCRLLREITLGIVAPAFNLQPSLKQMWRLPDWPSRLVGAGAERRGGE